MTSEILLQQWGLNVQDDLLIHMSCDTDEQKWLQTVMENRIRLKDHTAVPSLVG